MPLEVAGETAVAADPSDGALDDSALRQHAEFVPLAAADDLDVPRPGAGDGGGHLRPLMARIADDALDEQQQPARLPQKRFGAAVLGLLDAPVPGVSATHPALVSLLWETTVAPILEMLRDTAAATVAA